MILTFQPPTEQQQAGCEGKQSFSDVGVANQVARRMRRNNPRTSPHAYKCRSCQLWHIVGTAAPNPFRSKRTFKRVWWNITSWPQYRHVTLDKRYFSWY